METPKEVAKKIPHDSGIYIFKDARDIPIYVGKAKDLHKRVSQYFDLREGKGIKTEHLVSQISSIDTIPTHSEFDALMLEAKLIREYNPKYNVIAKDDKSPLYLCITSDEELPRLLFIRKTGVIPKRGRIYFGPFQSGRIINKVLRELRSITPFCTQKIRNGHPCFYTHLGLCNPCPSEFAKKEDRKSYTRLYRRNIRILINILSGKSLTVLHAMEKEMQKLSGAERFEEAEIIKSSIRRLQQLHTKHYDPIMYVTSDSFLENIYESEMNELKGALTPYYPHIATLHRVECMDISNTMGTNATGSLVVLIDGRPSSSDYRRFRIKTKKSPDDFAMIAEVVKRRFSHTEWPYPDLLVIDGGKGQVGAALEAIPVPVIGLAKRFENIIVPVGKTFMTVRLPVAHKGLHLLQRIRDESHRFAITYHKLLRKKNFLDNPKPF